MTFNGKVHNRNWISHKDMQSGGVINFTMNKIPNRSRGVLSDAFPYSFSTSNN
jgi:putative alpha-1,2-mannosidase